jgi:hypothetical protein
VARDVEPSRELRLKTQVTTLELKHLAATVAAEVMMVRFAGHLVAHGLAGHRDRSEPVTLEQRADVAIDGGDAEAFDFRLGGREDLIRRERTISTEKGLPDG